MSTASGPAPSANGAPRPQLLADASARLRLVPAAGTRASSGAFVLLLTGLLGVGLLGLLAVNTVLAQGSFTTSDLAAKQDALVQHEQQLQREVALLQSPQQLAAAATALRHGFEQADNDPDFIKESVARNGIPYNYVSVEQGRTILRALAEVSPQILSTLRESIGGQH